MKAIFKAFPRPGGLTLEETKVPEVGHNDVLIKVKACAICGTDLHIYNWDKWSQQRVKVPRIIGHEFAGEIVEVGSEVKFFKKGDYVSGEGHLFCGVCKMCRTGQAHVCENWKGLGYDVDGAFAEYVVIPEKNVWKNSESLPLEVAAIQDPLGNAVNAVFEVDCVAKNVAVFGAGPVGALSIAILRTIGAERIIAIEKGNEYRKNLARIAGATHILDVNEVDNIPEAIKEITGGEGVDVSLEMAGSKYALNDAIKSTRSNGDVVIMGIPSEEVPINIAEGVVFKSLRLHGVVGRKIYDTWYRMKGLLDSGRLDVTPLITHKFKFEEYEKGFKLMQSGECGKVVLMLE